MNIGEFFRSAITPASGSTSPFWSKTAPQADTHIIRDGLVIYRRERSLVWQCRFKLRDGRWHRLSTGCIDLDQAQQAAIRLSEQWAIRQELGLPVKIPCFSMVANAVIDDLRLAASNNHGKVVYRDYIVVIERYLIPFFGQRTFETITPEVIREFDGWRIGRLRKVPRASTLRTHASAFSRVIALAKQRGLLPLNKTPPTLTTEGERSQPQPTHGS